MELEEKSKSLPRWPGTAAPPNRGSLLLLQEPPVPVPGAWPIGLVPALSSRMLPSWSGGYFEFRVGDVRRNKAKLPEVLWHRPIKVFTPFCLPLCTFQSPQELFHSTGPVFIALFGERGRGVGTAAPHPPQPPSHPESETYGCFQSGTISLQTRRS